MPPPPVPAAPHRQNAIALQYQGYGVHRDDCTIDDRLDRRRLVRTLAEQIAADQAPMVLGLHGDWGSGKTSALKAIQYHLDNREQSATAADGLEAGLYRANVFTVWFEAWRYQHEPVPVVALLHAMRRQLSLWNQTKDRTRKLSVVAFESVLDGLDKAAKLIGAESLPISAKEIRANGDRYERDRLEQPLQADTIQDFLRETIKALLPEQRKGFPSPRLVVFIDDLDRCSAESAYRLLEGLKIYLQLDNCVFVLGMNQQVVIEAIAERLKKDDQDKAVVLRAEAYLEKLCSNIWRLPLPADPVDFFANMIDDDAARKAIVQARQGGTPLSSTPCPSFLPPNPRRLRALANTYNRLIATAEAVGWDSFTTDRHLRLLLVAYLYQFHSELYQRWHYDRNFLLRLQGWLSNASPADEKTEPHLWRLSLPTLFKSDTSSPTPGTGTLEGRYPDPSSTSIFWIAPLLQLVLRNTTPQEFDRLLTLAI